MSKLSDFIEELLSKKTRVALRDLVNEIKYRCYCRTFKGNC